MKHAALSLMCAAVLLSCSSEGSKQYLDNYIAPKNVVDMDTATFDPKGDILFVVDNSGSMGDHQRLLAENIKKFTEVFLKSSILDFNIAVVSTDTERLWGTCCGEFYGTIKVVNRLTPNADEILAKNLMIGIGGSGYERLFDPVMLALSENLLQGVNKNFLREDAGLSVIFITDAEDQSKLTDAAGLLDFLVKLKNGDRRKVMGYGAIIPSGVSDSDCKRDPPEPNNGGPGPEPKRIESFLGMIDPSKKNILSLCDPNYGELLAQFASDIVNQVGSSVLLSRPPIQKSIRVMYGDLELPRDVDYGWSYEPDRNAIRLGTKIDWSVRPYGTKVQVFYEATKFAEEVD